MDGMFTGPFSFQGCVDFRETAWSNFPINRSVPERHEDEKHRIKGKLKGTGDVHATKCLCHWYSRVVYIMVMQSVSHSCRINF